MNSNNMGKSANKKILIENQVKKDNTGTHSSGGMKHANTKIKFNNNDLGVKEFFIQSKSQYPKDIEIPVIVT